MARRDYDDVVSIRRDSIAGRAKTRYGSTISDMHFGSRKLCHSVSRAAWSKDTQERGLVYCDSGQCILVPTVCRNVSRIARAEVAHEHAEGDVPEFPIVPVAMIEPAPVPIPLDALPAWLIPEGGSEGAPTPDALRGAGYGHGFGGAGGGGGSFAAGAGAGAGSGINPAAGQGGFEPGATPGPGTDVAIAITPVPEPQTWGLMLAGLAALAARRRRRA